MNLFPSMNNFFSRTIDFATALFFLTTLSLFPNLAAAQVNLTEGDIAVIGWCDNRAPQDLYTFVTLREVPAATIIYFTNNGWTGTDFRKVNDEDGDGFEQLVKMQTLDLVPAGTIITSYGSAALVQWTLLGAIPDADTGSFGPLAQSQNGDQIYAFQSPSLNNPLLNVSRHVFLLDDTGAFEPAVGKVTGDIPPGLSIAAGTALTILHNNGNDKAFMAFNTHSIPAGTKSQWLAAIKNPRNWTLAASGSQPEGSIIVIPDIGCADADGDTICDTVDICPNSNDLIDTDGDAVPDGCDLCPGSDDSIDLNSNGIPDGCETCPADLTADGVVDGADLGLLLGNWDLPGVGDLDQDGFVTGADLGLLLGAWGSC